MINCPDVPTPTAPTQLIIIYRKVQFRHANDNEVRLAHVKENLNEPLCADRRKIKCLRNPTKSNEFSNSLSEANSIAIHHTECPRYPCSRIRKLKRQRLCWASECRTQIPFLVHSSIHSFSSDLVDLLHSKEFRTIFDQMAV